MSQFIQRFRLTRLLTQCNHVTHFTSSIPCHHVLSIPLSISLHRRFYTSSKDLQKATKKNRVIIDKQYLYEDHSLPGRYATALYRVCIQKTCLEDVWSDIESLRDCMKGK